MVRFIVHAAACLFSTMTFSMAAESDNTFLRASKLSKQDVQSELMSELNGNITHTGQKERITQLEDALREMFVSLPKDADGKLEHTVMRYALHRLMAKERGWFVIGLEPERDGRNMSVTSIKTMMEWAPAFLQDAIENQMHSHSVGLHELAVLASTLEDLAQREESNRLQAVYDIYNFSKDQPIPAQDATQVIDSYVLVYFKGGNWTAKSKVEAYRRVNNFKHNHKAWKRLNLWLRAMQVKHSNADSTMTLEGAKRIAQEISYSYGTYNEEDCSGLKSSLVALEDRMPGRVLLSDFYKQGLYGQWKFTEKVDYLRTLGALDESDADRPRVIVPNYVGSRPQCREASGLYAVCCPNECESLTNTLEHEIAQPAASPQQIIELVQKLSSPSVIAPRTLSDSLIARLDQVAAANDGHVPLHGRLFAQWMHNAFPRECPYPHTSGTTSPQTPDEWIAQTGHESHTASEEEMLCHVSGPCAGGSASGVVDEQGQVDIEIPWTDIEELMHTHKLVLRSAEDVQSDFEIPLADWQEFRPRNTEQHRAFNRLMRTIVLSGVALGLAVAAKMQVADASDGVAKNFRAHGRRWLMAQLLFFVPLLVVTMDYFFDLECMNEFGLCALCWAMASAVAYSGRDVLRALVVDEGDLKCTV